MLISNEYFVWLWWHHKYFDRAVRSQPYRYPDGAQQRQELHPRQRNNCTDEPIIVESLIIAAPRSFKCLIIFLAPRDLWKSLALHLHAKSPQLPTTKAEVWHHRARASRGSSCEDGPM